MQVFAPLSLALALRYSLSGRRHRFASFVALMSTLGIALGVCALITVTAVMYGLQQRLSTNLLSNAEHLIVKVNPDELDLVMQLPGVLAAAPGVGGQVLVQSAYGMAVAFLTGSDLEKLRLNPGVQLSDLNLPDIPPPGSFAVKVSASLLNQLQSLPLDKLRLISTQNARYTPVGLVPSQRLFQVDSDLPSAGSAIPLVIGNFNDVRRLLRAGPSEVNYRIWLADPFAINEIEKQLPAGILVRDWRQQQGEFFKAVALERLTMSLLLCLIILVAAFNILSALSMMVSARVHDIAVLKTLGLSSGRIMLTFILMGMYCGIIGCVLGTLTGIPLAMHASQVLAMLQIQVLPGNESLPSELNAGVIISINLIALILSALCTLYPAYKAAAADPVSNLRHF